MFKIVRKAEGERLALAVFTVESFNAGSNYTQYFAAFDYHTDEEGKRSHYTLVEAIPVGGESWRTITHLNAKVLRNSRTFETQNIDSRAGSGS